ncbi:MAG: hypothetical protein ACI88A_003239 [Paraglaciecola sp.]
MILKTFRSIADAKSTDILKLDDISKLRIYAVLLTTLFLLINWYLGHIFIPDNSTTELQRRDLGAACALPIISGFLLFLLPSLHTKAQVSVMQSALTSNSSIKLARLYARHISTIPRALFTRALFIGIGIALSYMLAQGLLYQSDLSINQNLLRIPIIAQACTFWSTIIWVMLSLISITILMTRFTSCHLRIELFHIEDLIPLANSVFWNTVICAVGLALSPIFWLGGQVPKLDLFIVFTLLIIITFLLFFPILRVRRIVRKKKSMALDRIRTALKQAVHESETDKRRLTDSQDRLVMMNNLVGMREEINRTKEWPLDMPIMARFFLIVIFPPLTWAGASIVDWLVKQVFV